MGFARRAGGGEGCILPPSKGRARMDAEMMENECGCRLSKAEGQQVARYCDQTASALRRTNY